VTEDAVSDPFHQENRPVFARRLRELIKLLLRMAYDLYVVPLREAFIDFRGLSLSLRILAVLGYVAVFALLALTLLFDLFRNYLALVTYVPYGDQPARQVPFVVMIACGLSLTLGWAYVLTGATDCRRRVFFPIVALFVVQLVFLVPLTILPLWCCTAPVLVVALVGAHFFTASKRYWRDFPIVEFVLWCCAMVFFIGMFWFSAQSVENLAKDIDVVAAVLSLISVPLWVAFGLAIVNLAVDAARTVVSTLRRMFPGEVLRALTVLLILIRPAGTILAFALNMQETTLGGLVFADSLVTVPLLSVAMIVVALRRRWNTRNAATILAISLILPLFILGVGMAISGKDISDILGLTLEGLGIFPPLLLFVVVMANNVLNIGAKFANKDGKYAPRSGRVTLTFGLAFLVIGLTIFLANLRDGVTGQVDATFQTATDNFFGLGLIFLGLPYLLWVLWRRRDELAGKEEDFATVEPIFAWLGRVSGRVWLVLSVVAIVLFTCLICLLGLTVFNTALPTP
jgi:hypothetical protein